MYKAYNAQDNLTITERLEAPTPKFFKKIRAIGITLTAIGTALLASGVVLHPTFNNIAGYLITAGSVIAAVCSTTVDYKELAIQKGLK